MHSPGTLAARRITKFHGARAVLEDVSVAVPQHARLGVVGPNGSGKTTLLRLLAGLDEAGRRVDELAAKLADDPGRAADHADALDRFLALGGDDFEARARATAAEVGIP